MERRNYTMRGFTCLLAAVLLSAMLAGCGQGNKKGDMDSAAAKGRYVEEDLALPLEEGEEVQDLTKTAEGNPLVFSSRENSTVIRYEYREGTWERTLLDWVSPLYEGKEMYWEKIWEGEDGTQLVLGMDIEDAQMHLARAQKGQPGEEVAIPYLTQQTDLGYPMITDLLVDANGNYWMYDFYQSKIAVVSADSGEVVQELSTVQLFSNSQKGMFQGENGNVAVNTEEGVFTVYDTGFQKTGILKNEQQENLQMCSDGENWYLVSEEGIVRLTVGNEMREVIMDGNLGSMGSSLNRPAGMTAGAEKDFYVLYKQDKTAGGSLIHYVYDAGAAAVPEQTLRVFGVSDNATIQEAILQFQKQNPDVKVEFQTAGSDGLTSDDIRTLNTELLSGNGADVLLLDGLPTESYVEKGILKDLTEITEQLMSQEEYLEAPLKNTVYKDGKVYGLPVRFSVPIQYGSETVKEALHSLESLSDYMEEHPQASVFGIADKTYIRDFLFQIFQEEMLGEDGKINQEKMARLLELELQIAGNARSEVLDEYTFQETGVQINVFQQGMFSHPISPIIQREPESVVTERISGVPNMMIPYTLMRELALSPETIRDMYVPHGIVGINQDTTQMEQAEQFVKYLFSREIQGTQLDDGLPVLKSALEKLPEETKGMASLMTAASSWNIEGMEDLTVEAGYPTAEEVEAFVKLCFTLEKPAKQDAVVWGIYQEEANQYLKGNTDAGTAAQNMAQKVDTYLAE